MKNKAPLIFLFAFIWLAAAYGQTGADNSTPEYKWELREPRAWSAILKYCVACHGADVIDKGNLTPPLWEGRINQCVLYMASRGYPRPTKADREALRDFLSKVTPVDREPPVYLYPPHQGSKAYP